MGARGVRRIAVLLAIAVLSAKASAEGGSQVPNRFSPQALEHIVRATAVTHNRLRASQPAPSQRRKDSILNGALIGAAVGGVGGSALVVYASGGSDDFKGAMLIVSPWTALGGFAAGALIDALR
jgi:hypothetical protein